MANSASKEQTQLKECVFNGMRTARAFSGVKGESVPAFTRLSLRLSLSRKITVRFNESQGTPARMAWPWGPGKVSNAGPEGLSFK